MLYVSFINQDVNLKYEVPVDESALQNIMKEDGPETINPDVEKYVLEWDEVKEVMESISKLVSEPVEVVTHQFLRLVETFEKKGAVIVNNKYKDCEAFMKVFKKYVKAFNLKNNIRSFPPDMAITTLACLVALKFQNLELELPKDCLPLYLNMSKDIPGENERMDESNMMKMEPKTV